jgi:predicted dithiol-disulfide oxidoreductase (DUF899 family)
MMAAMPGSKEHGLTEDRRAAVVPLWPAGASQEHIDARIELAKAEQRLHDQLWQVTQARHKLPPGPMLGEYRFTEGPADLRMDGPVATTTVRDLFGEHGTLLVYHLMFRPGDDDACGLCSLWVDSLHGIAIHIAQNTALAVVGNAPLPRLRAWALQRGWDGLRILSSHGTTFSADMNAESADGRQRPVVSLFTRDGDQVRHVVSQSAGFLDGTDGASDLLTPAWHLLDALPAPGWPAAGRVRPVLTVLVALAGPSSAGCLEPGRPAAEDRGDGHADDHAGSRTAAHNGGSRAWRSGETDSAGH